MEGEFAAWHAGLFIPRYYRLFVFIMVIGTTIRAITYNIYSII